MVDLEQFREAVKCWRRSAAACGSSDDVKEADRLLSIIDNAKVAHEISAPTGRPARAWTEQEKAACKAALRRIVEMEEADNAGKVCPCGEATCTESWEPGCGLGQSVEHAVPAEREPPRGDELRAILARQPAPVVDDAMMERALNAKVGYLSVRQLFACEREARQGVQAILTAAQQPAAVVDEAMVERALNAKVRNWPVRQLFDSDYEARIAMRAALTVALSSVQGVESP